MNFTNQLLINVSKDVINKNASLEYAKQICGEITFNKPMFLIIFIILLILFREFGLPFVKFPIGKFEIYDAYRVLFLLEIVAIVFLLILLIYKSNIVG